VGPLAFGNHGVLPPVGGSSVLVFWHLLCVGAVSVLPECVCCARLWHRLSAAPLGMLNLNLHGRLMAFCVQLVSCRVCWGCLCFGLTGSTCALGRYTAWGLLQAKGPPPWLPWQGSNQT